MTQDTLIIPEPLDRHVHPRRKKMAQVVFPYTVKQFPNGAVIMGNHPHPHETSTVKKTLIYQKELLSLLPPRSDFVPRMTCYLTDDISPDEVVRGFRLGVWCAVKLYMANRQGQGGTTGSSHGVKDLVGRYPVLEAMERHQIPLLGHFEATEEEVDEFDREIVSVDSHVAPIVKRFPGLPIVFEHITDGRAADFVAEAPSNVYATVTAHHLMLNRNALFWGGMNPLHFCKPVLKRELHRLKVRQYVTSGNRKFGAGTDSAPWVEAAKSRPCGCAAGIFTAEHAVELYTTVFDEDNALKHLGAFLSENFVDIYGAKVSEKMMTLERTPRYVPKYVSNKTKSVRVRVFKGDTYLPWTLVA